MGDNNYVPERKKKRFRRWWRRYHLSVVIGAGFLLMGFLYIGTSLPAPHNLVYQYKLATRDPNYQCKDGVYSFAATPQGACSGHGGIQVKMRY